MVYFRSFDEKSPFVYISFFPPNFKMLELDLETSWNKQYDWVGTHISL